MNNKPSSSRRRPGSLAKRAPVGLGHKVQPRLDLIAPGSTAPAPINPLYERHPACSTLPQMACRHPLTDLAANAQLGQCEDTVKGRFDRIVPFLRAVVGIPLGVEYVTRVQELAQSSLGHTFPEALLEDNWIRGHNLRGLFGYAAFKALAAATDQFSRRLKSEQEEVGASIGFLLDCGFHTLDISPCADGRLKGLLPYILRLPMSAFTFRKAYAGTLFDIETDLQQWQSIELRRYREGVPNTADAATRYLKIAVYHFSTSDPTHEGCAAHGSNDHQAIEASHNQLIGLRQAVENAFCCGASVETLLIGVDTDTDAVRIHIPDQDGNLNPHRYVDNAALYAETLGMSADQAILAVHDAIRNASSRDGWAKGNGLPHEGMQRFIATLLINNLSQIDYVVHRCGGRYPLHDIGHAERFISAGDGLDEVQIRNLAYYAHLHTVEENAADIDVGIKIFKKLNVARGLPIPIAVHYRYDSNVPGARDRAVERARQVRAAIANRHHELAAEQLLQFRLSVQDHPIGSPIEEVPVA
ncbi:carboxysome shell carbonic anhydrase [Halothiobacillus sp. DCM-1]|uniref:carboxysome shell carbonic anhydrase n=1 Tax=Halothiobacillus sp. DCM-1 TaxID=3112558 RepID=UPI00325283E1